MNKRPIQRKEKDDLGRKRLRLLVATTNEHKVREIGEILGPRWKVFGMGILLKCPAIRETGKTFEANASLKAESVCRFLARSQKPALVHAVLADDSGLEVARLRGAPGVRSARYARKGGDAGNRRKLLRALEDEPDRRAAFRCVLALIPFGRRGRPRFFRGEVHGRIAGEEKGSRGFGYDSVFIPSGFDRTFAEMSVSAKNRISHRARALEKLRRWLVKSRLE